MSIRILHSIPSGVPLARSAGGISVLLILDSSFNPPTKAHAFLLHQAIKRLRGSQHGSQHGNHHNPAHTANKSQHQLAQARILLLLSTKNADKPSAPASVEQRVAMMRAFALGMLDGILSEKTGSGDVGTTASTITDGEMLVSGIDVGLSSEPRFLEKSVFLATPSSENPYSAMMEGRNGVEMGADVNGDADGSSGLVIPQWHLLGFDTLVRLLDGKYYEPSGSLDVLGPLFEGPGNRVFVMQRGEEGNDQEDFVQKLHIESDRGGFQGKGWNVDWAQKVELLPAFEGVSYAGKMLEVSSTAVRNAAKDGDASRVQSMCHERVAEYVVQEGLYGE